MPIALLSLYDTSPVVAFADKLVKWGWHLIALKDTAEVLTEAGLPVKYITELNEKRLSGIDLVYVTLCPLIKEMQKDSATLESVREKTDIDAPTMLRSAAKNRLFVISNNTTAARVFQYLHRHEGAPVRNDALLQELAYEAELTVTSYVLASAIALCSNHTQRLHLIAHFEDIAKENLTLGPNL